MVGVKVVGGEEGFVAVWAGEKLALEGDGEEEEQEWWGGER